MRVDMHVHTNYSWDSIIKLEELKGVVLGDDVVAITDHDNMRAHKKAKNLGINFIPGEEITTNLGHLLAYFINEEVNPKKEKMNFFEALDKIKEQGAISCFAHPFDKLRKSILYDKREFNKALRQVDAIEVFNGKNKKNNDEKALESANKLEKLKTAGSDSHQLSRVFTAYVEMDYFDFDNPKDFIKKLKRSKPFLLRRRSFGEFLNLKIRKIFYKLL